MRLSFAVPLVLVLLAGCDDSLKPTTQLTAPEAPGLTLKNLSADASSVCRANVASRDAIHAKGANEAALDPQVAALNSVISDVCY